MRTAFLQADMEMSATWLAEPAAAPTRRRPVRAKETNCRRRTARAAVLWGIAVFALSQVALRFFIERRLPELRDPTFEIKYRQLPERLASSPSAPAQVVFPGWSSSARG